MTSFDIDLLSNASLDIYPNNTLAFFSNFMSNPINLGRGSECEGALTDKWVEGCETCAKDKRVPNDSITPELLILPGWDLGAEDAMQVDLLPNLPTSRGYPTVMTAIYVFSR